jgi:hypothetical protein
VREHSSDNFIQPGTGLWSSLGTTQSSAGTPGHFVGSFPQQTVAEPAEQALSNDSFSINSIGMEFMLTPDGLFMIVSDKLEDKKRQY